MSTNHTCLVRWLLGCSLALGLVGCRGFDVQTPEGFAEFDDWDEYRAVSPEGITFRVRAEENDPPAKLDFWREALKKRMTDAGYAFVTDSEIKAGERPGYLLELAAPVGTQDYTYLVAIFVRGDNIVIAESAGEVSQFVERRDAVLKAIATIR